MSIEQFDELKKLINEVIRIYESEAAWEIKYNLIFSKHLSHRIRDIIKIDYHDPDTSYEEDLKVYVDALKKYLEAL